MGHGHHTSTFSEGYGYQTAFNNTLPRTLLPDHGKAVDSGTAKHLKKGITVSELKALEKKLSEALGEIHRVMEPEARP